MIDENKEKLFWSKIDIKGPNECWNWKAGKDSYGDQISGHVKKDTILTLTRRI